MKADWIRGLRARGLDFAVFLGQSFEPRSARFEERRRPPLVRVVLDGSWTNDVRLLLRPFLLLSVDTPSRHLSTDDFHSAIYWPPDTLVYYSYCERWHYSMAFRNLWQCGGDIKELLSAIRNGTRLLHGPFSFVRGKWMVALKKNTRLILILRGEDRD